jgi:predicted RNase H-like nuclease (RuvC/YqgF family)
LLDDLKETKARVEKNKIENANLLAEINKLKRENTELTNRLQDIKNYIK